MDVYKLMSIPICLFYNTFFIIVNSRQYYVGIIENESLKLPSTNEGHICKNCLVITVCICDTTKQPKLDGSFP